MPIERLQPGPRMSQAVIHNQTVYLAGQVAPGAAPARATVASAQLAAPEYAVEIAVIAAQA
jgi:enamine deaminase RidA (YjgF/YER057c/UK114 family)